MTTTLVRFRTGRGLFAVRVAQARGVHPAGDLVPMPSPGPDVAGVVPRPEGPLTVLAALGSGQRHVLVLDPGEGPFGLLVEEVTGLVRVEEAEIGPPPAGQEGRLVAGVLSSPDGLVMVIDAGELARRLGL